MEISREAKSGLYRVLTDLIKADKILAVDELDFLDKVCADNGIGDAEKVAAYQMTLGEAFAELGRMPAKAKDALLTRMKSGTVSDGECTLSESLLVEAAHAVFSAKAGEASVFSMPSGHVPFDRAQIIYVEDREKGRANIVLEKDDEFDEIRNIVRLGGFELIYIPRIARHYADYRNHRDLERVIRLVSPVQTQEQLDNTIHILQHMSTQYFYRNILKQKLQMPLEVQKPIWLIRLPDDVVNGNDYANFLCIESTKNVKSQLGDFVSSINSRMHEYPIVVNARKDTGSDFLYRGFYKAILDVMAIKEVDRWEIRLRTYGDGTSQFVDPETGKKAVFTIWKDGEEYPLFINGRDAAFYTLLLCASVSSEKSVDFDDIRSFQKIQRRYELIYQKLSRRSIYGDSEFQRCPDVTLPANRIPMKSRLCTAIRSSKLTEQSLYLPQEKGRNDLYIPIEPERVKVITHDRMENLAASGLYKAFLAI